MAVSTVGNNSGTVGSDGLTGTGTATAVTTLPTGTAAGDRVFIMACAVGTLSAPSGWTEVANLSLGSGTLGATTGPRWQAVFYRDYDGVWTMPSVVAASAAANSLAAGSCALTKGAGESWSAPTFVSGSDTTSDTSFSVTASSSITLATGSALIAASGWPSNPSTQTTPNITATGTTLGTQNVNPAAGGTTTGNDAYVGGRTALVTTGGSTTPVMSSTLTTARTGGTIFVHQASAVVVTEQLPVRPNPARFRATNW